MSFNFSENEKKVLAFWQQNAVFQKLRTKNQGGQRWSFLDGPITANNPMGVHHAWGRTYKDLFQRYKAMRGFDERYQNGFDCQGLWVEVEVEKEKGFQTKKDIEAFGIGRFVEACKARVRKYAKIQTNQSIRLGQWMDWQNSYYTMSDENNYAIWHFLKKCHEKGYLYKGRDSVPWCPRCSTAISQHEILTEEYKELTHEAVYVRLPITTKDKRFKDAFFLVWTTTPWTLPANVALAVHPDFVYASYKKEKTKERVVLLKKLAEKVLDKDFVMEEVVRGKELVGLTYDGPFDNLKRVKQARKENPKTFHTVVAAPDLVTAEEGTGIVHIAPGAGAEDFQLAKEQQLPVISVIDGEAVYLDGLGDFEGKNAKKQPALIFDYLRKHKKKTYLYKTEPYTHRYPTCWRCKEELVWRVVSEWYISMERLRPRLMEIAKTIQWIPSFGLDRELDWLKNMHDWLISKKRYWGLALPIFECEKCKTFEVVGSQEELKKRAVEGWEQFAGRSPHRPWVDAVKIKCEHCGEAASRVPDVSSPWLDAGIVPFSTMGYYQKRDYWKHWFPAALVCESFPGQFKNWFYSLLVMSAVLEDVAPMKTVFGFASVHDENDEEMHKSKGNALWFDDAVEKIGADPMRWMYVQQNPAANLRFGYKAGEEVKRKLLTLYNTFVFFSTYTNAKAYPADETLPASKNILDRWILSRLQHLIATVTKRLDQYDVATAVGALERFFVDDLSLWYVRRSRKRFRDTAPKKDQTEAAMTLYYVLLQLTKLIAPAVPFLAERLYAQLRQETMPLSVHLCDWPTPEEGNYDAELEAEMQAVRSVVAAALAARSAAGIKVRQPIASLKIKSKSASWRTKTKNNKQLLDLIKEEVNVKKVLFSEKQKEEVTIDTKLTKALEEEGQVRDIIRHIQSLRKKAGLQPKDTVSIEIFIEKGRAPTLVQKKKTTITKETGAKKMTVVKEKSEHATCITIGKKDVWVSIIK